MNHWLKNPKLIILGPLALLLVAILACGSSATATPVPQTGAPAATTAAPTAVPSAGATSVPAATAAPTKAPEVMTKPSGTLNVGQKELGPYFGSPKLSGNPQIFLNSAAPITETLGMHAFEGDAVLPMLAESWDVSADGTTWTYHIRKGVQFHKGYGEMTAEDVQFSFNQIATSEKHARSSVAAEIFFSETGSQTVTDDYTWVVDSGEAFSDIPILELLGTPRSVGAWIVSKKQYEDAGEEEANRNTAATGPWEIGDWESGQFWELNAVEDHYRQTPAFAKMIEWEIPEESARVAGFKTGNLDTFVMALDSIGEVESVDGAVLMQVANAAQSGLNFYGATHLNARDSDEPWPNFDPELAWVSESADEESESWQTAVKVRRALSIAIDRQTIIDELLLGFGHTNTLQGWGGPHESRYESDMVWEYDPEAAKALLAEAGYPDGFDITLTAAVRGAPSEVEACEAVAQYWEDIGVNVNLQSLPYGTLRPTLVARTYQGATCHSVSIRGGGPTQGYASFTNASNFSYGSEHPFLEEYIGKAKSSIAREDRIAAEDALARWNFDNVFAMTGLYVNDNIWPVGPNINPWDGFIKQGDLRQINGFEYITPR